MKTIHKTLVGLGVFSAIIGLSSCSSSSKETSAKADKAVSVSIGLPSLSQNGNIQLSGKLESENTANISTRMMGYISSIKVKIGQHVSKGQLLATISSQDILAKKAQANAMIASAEAAYKNAAKDYERFQNLYKQHSVSEKELENVNLQYVGAKSNLESAKQMLNEVNAMLNYTHITAPFAGVVTQKLADEGSMANPGMPLLIIEQNGNLLVNATVSESDVSSLKKGDAAQIQIKSTGKVIQGKVVELSPSSQASGGQYVLKISIPTSEQKGLLSGMYVNALIASKSASNTASSNIKVPVSSIINRDQLTGLYVVSDKNTASLRWVRLGKISGSEVEVISGLNANERYVIKADGKLYNGVPVSIKM